MFLSFCDAAWRVVVLLGLALVPYAAPVDAVSSTSVAMAAMRLAAFVVIVLALGLLVRGRLATSKPLALAVTATLFVAVALSFVFDGDAGPLARGAWIVAPFAWASIALLAAGPIARRVARGDGSSLRSIRNGSALVVVAAAVLSFAVSMDRLGSRDKLWKLAFAADPGSESAAIAVAEIRRGSGDIQGAYEAERACVRAHPVACRCEEGADADAIDLGKYSEARASLDAASACPRTPRRVGLAAEALVGTNALDEGLRQAEIALSSNPNEPHALYARAWGTMLKGNPADAKKFAEQAVAMQRGLPAHLLLGLISYRLADLDAASVQFEAALKDDPNSVQANYDTGLVAQQRSRYHDARESYLKTLRLDPTYADAQYNLVILTFNAGAAGEAQHRLEEMTKECPGDRRLSELRGMLARGAPPPRHP
jgi:tetratricopeptide (TPR) repeat protein